MPQREHTAHSTGKTAQAFSTKIGVHPSSRGETNPTADDRYRFTQLYGKIVKRRKPVAKEAMGTNIFLDEIVCFDKPVRLTGHNAIFCVFKINPEGITWANIIYGGIKRFRSASTAWSRLYMIFPFCSAPGSLDTSLSHAAGLIEIAACHA